MNYLNGEITISYAEDLTWDFIIQNELVSEEALRMITHINGYKIEVFNDVIYYATGYHDIKQLWECEQENFYFNDEIVKNIDSNYFDLG